MTPLALAPKRVERKDKEIGEEGDRSVYESTVHASPETSKEEMRLSLGGACKHTSLRKGKPV